jgi:ubiquinone/menaquinone biosynthesis C-methylase UbiE
VTSLSVGCGGNERYPYRGDADVNVDLSSPTQRIPGFVRADAHHLPFRPSIFKNILASHLLEHCNNPTKVTIELLRVCNGELTIIVPHWISPNAWRDSSHRWSFRPRWFHRTFRNYKVKVHLNYRSILRLLGIPNEIVCEVTL